MKNQESALIAQYARPSGCATFGLRTTFGLHTTFGLRTTFGLHTTFGQGIVATGMRQWLRTLLTLNGSPRGVAGGFALGLSLSLVPLPFAGMLVALALAPVLRCNLPATYAGTAIVNPLTGPFIYFAELWLGLRVMGRALPSWTRMQELDAAGWWEVFEQAVVPFMLGASLCCAAAVVISFPLLWWLVARWQAKHPHPPAEPAMPAEP